MEKATFADFYSLTEFLHDRWIDYQVMYHRQEKGEFKVTAVTIAIPIETIRFDDLEIVSTFLSARGFSTANTNNNPITGQKGQCLVVLLIRMTGE